MSYAQGQSITLADLNAFTGGQAVTTAFASNVAATQKVSAIFGVGYGDRGYGQSTPTLAPPVAADSDPSFASVTALLHMEGANGGTTFTDVKGGTWTPYGATTSTAFSKFGSSSLNLTAGTGARVEGPAATFGTGDFTVEGWAYSSSLAVGRQLYANSNAWTSNAGGSAWWLGSSSSTGGNDATKIEFGFYGVETSSATGVIPANSWFHWAISRSGTTVRVFVNGAVVITVTQTGNMSTPTGYKQVIGNLVSTSAWPGYIDEVRITTGVARYTTAFTVPSMAFAESVSGSLIPVSASDWLNLRNVIASCASHQGTATTLLPPASDFVAGASIKAEASATTAYDFATMIANVDSNRFNTNSGASMTLTANALTISRASTWGAGSAGITCTANATFASEDAARYFFNSGGEIRFALSHPTGSTQDNNWNAALAAVGTVAFKAHSTTRSGTAGTPAAIGYYELTTSAQTILSGAIGSGAYSTNSITVTAAATSITGANGAKGFQIQFVITLSDSHTNAWTDVCAAGTAAVFSHLKATAVLSGIASPTISQVVGF